MTNYHNEVRILQELLDEELISEYYLKTVVDLCLFKAADVIGVTDKTEFCKQVRAAAQEGRI